MQGPPRFVTLAQALEIASQIQIATGVEEVDIEDAGGRITAHDLAPLIDDPPFDNSAMDGWAVVHRDTTGASSDDPCRLKIIDSIAAGRTDGARELHPGEACRIMTGAPIPPGADSIIQVESTDQEGDMVALHEPSKPHFIRRKGENLKKNQIAIPAGTLLSPAKLGLCATMGHSTITVQRRLKIAIISTGDELRPPGSELKPGQLYESNSYGLAELVRWMGHDPIRMKSVGDDLDLLRDSLNIAAIETDIIITSGGVSMGDHDLVRKIMEDEGEIKFWRVRIRPGSPPLFGTWNGTPLWGLPGNPVSSHVVFRMLVAEWIRFSTGAEGPRETRIKLILGADVKTMRDGLTLRRLLVKAEDDGLVGHHPTHQGSGNLNSLVLGDALTLIPPGPDRKAGEIIDALLY